MTDTVVISLSRFLPDARRIAAFLDADIREYHAGIFAEVFPEVPENCRIDVHGHCCPMYRPAF